MIILSLLTGFFFGCIVAVYLCDRIFMKERRALEDELGRTRIDKANIENEYAVVREHNNMLHRRLNARPSIGEKN